MCCREEKYEEVLEMIVLSGPSVGGDLEIYCCGYLVQLLVARFDAHMCAQCR